MKKLIALLLSIAIAFSFVIVPADASSYSDILGIDESQYDMALYYEHLWENYNHDMHGLLWEAVCDPQYYVYPQVVEEVGSDGWIEFASNITEEQLSKERHVEILSNLLVMLDYNTKDLIAEQVNADSTKKLKDYVVDVTGILVQTVSLDAAFGSHVTKNMERIATTMDLTWGFADFTIDTIEIYESLDRTLRQYENHREFLSAIAQNTTNATLKNAALELGEATDKAFFCKVNAVADTASGLAGYLGKDVFFDTIVLEYMVADASVLGISENDVAVLGVLKSAYEYMGTLQLAADLGVFAGDAIIGISDVMNRYNEMRALTDIRNALIQQMTSYRDSIQDVADAEKIGKLCTLTKNLIYVNFRGEYCAHEMSTHDAQLYSLIIKINGQAETSDRVYDQAKENTEIYSMSVDMIFPEKEFYYLGDNAYTDEPSKETFESFEDIIIKVQNRINYTGYSASQKEYCRGDFFEIDGRNALVMMYYVLNSSELTPGYYVGLWVENSDSTLSCLTDQLIEEVGDPDDAYVTVNIRKIDGKMYLNPYVRKANGNTDISKNQYYLIGDELVLEYNLYSEGNNYYLNQEQIEQSTFYSTQDKLNIRTFVLELNPNWSEGCPPQGYTFEELLAQLGDEAEVDTEETQGQSVFYEDGFVGNETVEQLRKSIVGSWGAEGSVVSDFDFNSDGTCYWSFDKQNEGTYQIRDDKMLVITFPWMDDRYFWTEETYEEWRSHSSQDCWYITDAGVLILNGVSYYRDGKVIKDYNTEGGLLATISGAWVLEDFMEYRFFKDGTFEENTVFVSNGMLLNRVDLDTGSIEIIDDTHAKLWNVAESFGELSGYTELVYDPETDTLCIGGSNNVYHRAEYLD